MRNEELKAIKDLIGKEISFEINWTTEEKEMFEKNTGITEFRENCIKAETLIELVEKQFKIIDEMAREIYIEYEPHFATEEEVKQYFYRKLAEK